MATPTVAAIDTALTAQRVAVANYSMPTGQTVTYRNPLTVLDTIERLQARTDIQSEGVVQSNIGFGNA